MEVTIKTRDEETIADFDYCDCLEIHFEGLKVFSVHDGESEDNNLSHNFGDVYKIGDLLRDVYSPR